MKRINYYLKIWWYLTKASFSVVLAQKNALLFFLTGKLIRFMLFIGFLYFLILGTKSLAGYNTNQVIFFFLTFNIIDVLAQFVFREVYRFRPKIISGDFDLILVKPLNPLFMSLVGGADFIDLLTIPPLLIVTYYYAIFLHPSFLQVLVYIFLLLNGLFIATGFYIFVLGLAVLTTEIDHVLWIFRDLSAFGRFPIEIYKNPLKWILTYILPIGVMIAIPAKALMGLVRPSELLISFVVGMIVYIFSIKFWKFALKKYASASS